MAWPRRSRLWASLLALVLAVTACGGDGGGGGSGGELLQTAFTAQLSARAGDTALPLTPVVEANLLLDVSRAARFTPPPGPVEVSATPGAGAVAGWWGLLVVDETHTSRVVAEAVGRAPHLAGLLPAELAGQPVTLVLARARSGAEIRVARHAGPRRGAAVAAIGGELGEYLRDRVHDLGGLLHQPWEFLDDLYDNTEEVVVDVYSDLLDSLIDPVLTDSDYFTENLDDWLDTRITADPLGRGPRTGEQTPVVFIHGITFRYPTVDPGEELDNLMAMVAGQLPDWDLRFHAMRFEYNPFGPVSDAADRLVEALVYDLRLPAHTPIVLVTYSLGGLVARTFDSRYGDLYPVRRLIMIGTPNGGAPVDEIRDLLLERAYEVGNVGEVTLPLGLFVRTVVQVSWARTYGSTDALEDIEVGSPLLATLAPPRPSYAAIAGVEVGGNLLLRRIRRVYHGAPNDGVVSVASVEAGLVGGADAKVTYADGHRDYVHASHGDLTDSPVVAAEVARILGEPLP